MCIEFLFIVIIVLVEIVILIVFARVMGSAISQATHVSPLLATDALNGRAVGKIELVKLIKIVIMQTHCLTPALKG
jgi:hypothetical protein